METAYIIVLYFKIDCKIICTQLYKEKMHKVRKEIIENNDFESYPIVKMSL